MKNHPPYIPCVEWQEQLAVTHPDDLLPSHWRTLERHVASCPACAAVRAEYQAIDALLLDAEDLEPLPVLPTWRLQPRKQPAHVPTMSELEDTRNMRLSELADRCMSEIDNYRRGEASSDQYCLEMFRRALHERDDEAWALLVDWFQEFLLAAFRRDPRSESATRLDSPENYVARAFARFRIAAVHNQQVAFTSLGAALRYLRVCLNGAILDTLRPYAQKRPVEEDQDEDSTLWEAISYMIQNERERRLAFLLYRCNFKPREIVDLFPQEFPDVYEIHRLRRNIVDRLQRGAGLIRRRVISEES